MSNLSKRVEKAKKLSYSYNPHEPGRWGTWGSKGADFGEKYYRVILTHGQEIINTPDGKKNISVFLVNCQKDTGNGYPCNCPGNERHTVCYHGLGAIYRSFELKKKLISFFETYESARCMSFGGQVAKIKSVNGNGYLWCVVKNWPEKPEIKIRSNFSQWQKKMLSVQKNINLMRGDEDDEGID